ncbi:MAG: hypothetical protein JW955_12880 [Sedimentisphaerales bacterium]|nr:hypothetical protein [Sedimentisphaerales bacterium]
MGEELRSISLCLLDDVNLADPLHLDEFEIRHFRLDDLQALLGGGETKGLSSPSSDQLQTCAQFAWARVERSLGPDEVKTAFDRCSQQHQLSYAHAGARSWYPFDELLRTLNLLKTTGGPVIGRQFYYWLEPLPEADRHIDCVIYGQPLRDYDGPDSEGIRPLVSEYHLDPSDEDEFCQLRKQLAQCLAADVKVDNSHLRTAIHYFENGDRKIVPHVLPGSFNAIEPLMSYEAALEALLIREDERRVGTDLPRRVAAMMERKRRRTARVEDFTRRVFSLRSKAAHGVKPIEEIEELIVCRPNDGIPDAWGEKTPIPSGDYANFLIKDGSSFPGFLVNLRELTRICIRFFCDALSQGQDKETTIESLDKTD